ncbi:MAG: GNAT family N-acetyltransferase [Flavobacteriaceae bacterium]|nr:GNAT family N-acetyltransferase [Flavobacteriaceae bacterium]
MKTLKGNTVYLRALEPTDLDFLYQLENNEEIWEVSNTTSPFSRFVLKQYLENSHKDIYEAKQLRLVICVSENDKAIGCIDLFDFEPKHKRIGVGILIASEENKNKGYASEALILLSNYVFKYLELHQIYAGITEDNTASIKLFEKENFIKTGVKKDWISSMGIFKNELQYQLINE